MMFQTVYTDSEGTEQFRDTAVGCVCASISNVRSAANTET